MFKISCVIEKAQKVNGEFRIRGIASDSSIDRDTEMISPEAIVKMRDRIKANSIPLRTEHEDKWYTEVGTVIDADLNDKGQLIIEAIIDEGISLGRDFIHICRQAQRGKREMPGFSIGGDILSTTSQFIQELNRSILCYTDIEIKEVSLVKYPSNINTTLEVSFAKSIKKENISNNVSKNMSEKEITKGVFADELLEEEIEKVLMERVQNMWHTLQEILLAEDKTPEDRQSAIDEFASMLKGYAEEYNMLLSDDEGIIFRNHINAQLENKVSKFTLPKFFEKFATVTKTEDPQEVELTNNETASEVITNEVEEHKEKEEYITKTEMNALMEQFVEKCISGVNASLSTIVEKMSQKSETTQEVSKSVSKKEDVSTSSSFEKSTKEQIVKMQGMYETIMKSYDEVKKSNEIMKSTIAKYESMALPRKSYASAQVLEKSKDINAPQTFAALLKHNETKADFRKAYASAREGIML